MTTLEKARPKTNRASGVSPPTQTNSCVPPPPPPATDDIVEQHDFIMEQLMLEPVDYDDLPATLSAQAVKSLCMIETECLCTLADILNALATEHGQYSHVPHPPRPSNGKDALETITRSMKQLVCAIMPPHRYNANNSPPPSPDLGFFEQLSHFVDSQSFWAFANNSAQYNPALCSELVHLVMATRTLSRQPQAKYHALYTQSTFGQTRHTLALLQHSLQDQLTQVDGAQYKELLRRLESVDRLLHESEASEEQLPAYEDVYAAAAGAEPATLSSPRSLSSSPTASASSAPAKLSPGHTSDEKEELDLERILRTVDRLAVPRLCNDQRVLLNERQSKQIVAATLTNTVERLCRGRLENQRATLRPSLCSLASCVFRSASRSLDDQRVELDARLQAKLDCAATVKLLNRMDRGRLTDQDFMSSRRIEEMTHITDMVARSMNRPRFARQRFYMSAAKERDLFMNNLLNKVDRLEGRRLVNQDAEVPRSRAEYAELDHIFAQLHNAKQHQFENQRASFSTSRVGVMPS